PLIMVATIGVGATGATPPRLAVTPTSPTAGAAATITARGKLTFGCRSPRHTAADAGSPAAPPCEPGPLAGRLQVRIPRHMDVGVQRHNASRPGGAVPRVDVRAARGPG